MSKKFYHKKRWKMAQLVPRIWITQTIDHNTLYQELNGTLWTLVVHFDQQVGAAHNFCFLKYCFSILLCGFLFVSRFSGNKTLHQNLGASSTRQGCNLFQDLWIIFLASIFLLFLPFFCTPNAGQILQCMTLTHYFLGFYMQNPSISKKSLNLSCFGNKDNYLFGQD